MKVGLSLSIVLLLMRNACGPGESSQRHCPFWSWCGWTGLCGSYCDCKMQFSNNHRGNFEKPQCVTGTWCAQGHTVRSILVCYSSVSQINYYSEMPSDPAANVVFWKGTVDISHISPNRMKWNPVLSPSHGSWPFGKRYLWSLYQKALLPKLKPWGVTVRKQMLTTFWLITAGFFLICPWPSCFKLFRSVPSILAPLWSFLTTLFKWEAKVSRNIVEGLGRQKRWKRANLVLLTLCL